MSEITVLNKQQFLQQFILNRAKSDVHFDDHNIVDKAERIFNEIVKASMHKPGED